MLGKGVIMIEEVSTLWVWESGRARAGSALLFCLALPGLGFATYYLAFSARRRRAAIFPGLLAAVALTLRVALWGEPHAEEAELTRIEARGNVAVSTTSGLKEGDIGIRLVGAREVLLVTQDKALVASAGLFVVLYCETPGARWGSKDPRILYCDRDPSGTDRVPDPRAEVVRERRSPYVVAE
jgi:hypothetical protein